MVQPGWLSPLNLVRQGVRGAVTETPAAASDMVLTVVKVPASGSFRHRGGVIPLTLKRRGSWEIYASSGSPSIYVSTRGGRRVQVTFISLQTPSQLTSEDGWAGNLIAALHTAIDVNDNTGVVRLPYR
jgi:hypothetical protein